MGALSARSGGVHAAEKHQLTVVAKHGGLEAAAPKSPRNLAASAAVLPAYPPDG
jgi:hypothetical protein